jgi:hypothetical protein
MTKYKKQASLARRKRKVFAAVQPQMNEQHAFSEHRLRRIRAYNLVPDTIDQLRAQHSKGRKAA